MKEKYQKFLLFSFVFFLGIFLFLLKPQTIFSYSFYCNNGPNKDDSGGCGTPCHCGQPWTKYYKTSESGMGQVCELAEGYTWWISRIAELCPTGDVCIIGEYGLRYGTCDCLFGSIYKTCCVGSTKVKCIRYGDPKWKRGVCPPGSTTVRGTSCPSSGSGNSGSGSSGGSSGCLTPYNGACPKGFVISGGCCICP